MSKISGGVQAGAAEKDVPIYKHIAELAGNSKLVHLCYNSSVLPVIPLNKGDYQPWQISYCQIRRMAVHSGTAWDV